MQNDARLLTIVASMLVQTARLRQVAEEKREWLLDENARLQAELKDRFRSKNIVSHATVMRQGYDLIGQVAKSNATALLLGDSGTGKEMVAHVIHYGNLWAERPFVRVHCGGIAGRGDRERVVWARELMAEGDVIRTYHLPPTLQIPIPSQVGVEGGLEATFNAIKYDIVIDALKAARGNRARAAHALRLTERLMDLRVKNT